MANLAYQKINSNGAYIDLFSELSLTATVDTVYTIEVFNPAAQESWVQSAESTPTDGGFKVPDDTIFQWKAIAGENLYIKTPLAGCAVNIGE
jgi:methyl coenzyme M reductase beta subunit